MKITFTFEVNDNVFDESYKILVNARKQIINLIKITIPENLKEITEKKIEYLKLNVRILNCLKCENIKFIKDLIILTERDLQITPNLGRRSILFIKNELKTHGLSLGMK